MTIDGLDQLAELIEGEREALLAAWRAQVRALPAARHLDLPTLNDHIPNLLTELPTAQRTPSEEPRQRGWDITGRHQRAKQLLADRVDPGAERDASEKTFEVVARDWHAHWKAKRHERHAHYVLGRLEADVFPEFGASKLSDLTTTDFRDAVRKIEDRGSRSARHRQAGPQHLRQDHAVYHRQRPGDAQPRCRHQAGGCAEAA